MSTKHRWYSDRHCHRELLCLCPLSRPCLRNFNQPWKETYIPSSDLMLAVHHHQSSSPMSLVLAHYVIRTHQATSAHISSISGHFFTCCDEFLSYNIVFYLKIRLPQKYITDSYAKIVLFLSLSAPCSSV